MFERRVDHGPGVFAYSACLLALGAGLGVAQAQSDPPDLKRYLDRLNAPILKVSEDEKAYEIYFEAYQSIDSSDPRAAAALVPDSFFHPYVGGFQEALEWAGEPDQQAALDVILKRDRRGFNATERQLIGMPYGVEKIPVDMAVFDFDTSWTGPNRQWLWAINYSYLSPYSDLACLLRAEAFRRAEEGDTHGAVEALMGFARMWRQLVNCPTAHEKTRGIQLLRHAMPDIRNFMWVYRDKLTIDDFKQIAKEIERLDLNRIELPDFEELVGEQLIEELYGSDNKAKPDKFGIELSRAATVGHPLRRFQFAESLRHAVPAQVAKRDQQTALKDVMDDWKILWRSGLHSSESTSYYNKLKESEYSIVKSVLADVTPLFEMRVPVMTEANGTATAAGIHAFIRSEGGRLINDQDAIPVVIPQKLAQVQPSFVGLESSLMDHYSRSNNKLLYTVVRNRDSRFAFAGYHVNTAGGAVVLREYWPLLYSVGPNGKENLDDKSIPHTLLPEKDDKGNIVYFPDIEMMMFEK